MVIDHLATFVIAETALKFKRLRLSLLSCRNIISLMDVSFSARSLRAEESCGAHSPGSGTAALRIGGFVNLTRVGSGSTEPEQCSRERVSEWNGTGLG